MNDKLVGGSVVDNGTIKAYVTAVGQDTVLSNILKMVKDAQTEKPPVQQLADKISAKFVPAVIAIAIGFFLVNYFFLSISITQSLMRSIAVLVISCPCAMGLATPAAIAVGLGRAAKNGILFRNAKSLELFKSIQTVVFDKTGTLTTGQLSIQAFETSLEEDTFKRIVYSLEKFSTHPIARSICSQWKTNDPIHFTKMEEIKGLGMKAVDAEGNSYQLGSYQLTADPSVSDEHSIFLIKNNQQLGWVDMNDTIRPESAAIIRYFKSKNIRTVLLSGDIESKVSGMGRALGMDEYFSEKSPQEKLTITEELTASAPTAMVGDGINDAPALAKATIGISMSDATQVAMQTSQVVLTGNGIQHLPMALGLGKHTFYTIRQNLFWAFIYNVIAIPVAGLGYLNPGIAALAMGFSDVVLGLNSIRLNYKKVV